MGSFISYDNNLDTTSPTGKLVFQIIGAVAEFEKDIIRERVVAGLENAKKKKQIGRPKIHDGILEKTKGLRRQGLSFRKIEKKLGDGEGTRRDYKETIERYDLLLIYAYQCLIPPRFRPTTPMIINNILKILTIVAGSRKYAMPIIAMRAVPTPDQIAYAMLTSIFLRARVSATKDVA